mmetsp:Transcript_42574/g.112737  ORF Transcript_42574/g.112737 Transcript_42574/m.112737 type:complete len:205 (+) Transcript_42574:115-729(+)
MVQLSPAKAKPAPSGFRAIPTSPGARPAKSASRRRLAATSASTSVLKLRPGSWRSASACETASATDDAFSRMSFSKTRAKPQANPAASSVFCVTRTARSTSASRWSLPANRATRGATLQQPSTCLSSEPHSGKRLPSVTYLVRKPLTEPCRQGPGRGMLQKRFSSTTLPSASVGFFFRLGQSLGFTASTSYGLDFPNLSTSRRA